MVVYNTDMAQRKARLRRMAASCRAADNHTKEDIAELRGVLDLIAAEKDARLFSPRVSTACSKQAARTYAEFVCTLEGSASKGKGEVLMLTRNSDLGKITRFLGEVFHLKAGGVLITVPEDRLLDEMEQLVLSTKHLHGLLDDFVLRQPSRRVLKVMKASLPITRCLVGAIDKKDDTDSEGATGLALMQLLELVQVPANLETLSRAGYLADLVVAVESIIGSSSCSEHVVVACHVVWKLAASDGMRRRMFEHGVQKKLWALAENIARTVETPEHRKKRQKAAEAAAEAAASADRRSTGASGKLEASLQELTAEEEPLVSEGENGQSDGVSITLQTGQELDNLAVKCIGAISLMLRSQETANALVGTKHHGLEILLELATVVQGRDGIGDERMPCLAAEALAHVLISFGACRMTWAERGQLVSLLDLMRSPLDRVVLCGTSILNAFLRGKPSQIVVTAKEAVAVLKEASLACQRCLNRLLGSGAPHTQPGPQQASDSGGAGAKRAGTSLPLHASMDAETLECLGILEQATAACWGSLAVIDRSPPGPAKQNISLSCWFPAMLAVANLSGTKWLSPWVIFCAVACIGVGVGTDASGGSINIAKMETLPGEMLALLKRTNSLELQEHAARTLCTLLSANREIRQKALQDGFLDKLQRLLMGHLGSAQLDSTIACSIMFLCDGDCAVSAPASGAEKTFGVDEAQEGGAGGCGARIKTRAKGKSKGNSNTKGKKRAKATNTLAWGVWSQKQLTSLVWALGHSNQDVLTYTAWTIWLLARRPENRVSLGRLWAVDGLVHALRSNARLDVKEGLLAAIWLLACDAENTTRLAMNGGLHLLVGVLNFPCSSCYVTLKALAVGTLCKLCRSEPDVATLGMHLSLAPALLQAVYDDTSTVYLKVLSAGLIFTLCRNAEHEANRTDYVKQFTTEGGPFILEEICADFLASGTSELQACGSFFAASLSLGSCARHRLHDNGGLEALCRLVRAPNTKTPLKIRSLHALLNLSTERSCQPSICKWALQALVEMTALGAPPQAEFASSILSNCAENPCCRAMMFEGQLARGSKLITTSRAELDLEESIRASLLAHRVANGSTSIARVVRERFLEWVQEIKEGGSTVQTAQRVGGGGPKNDEGTRRPETNTAEVEDGPSKKGPTHRGGMKPKLTATLKRREDDVMLRVRQDIRQPVTSLWQTAAERASTAPTRAASRRGGMVDCTKTAARDDLPQRRPHTQMGVARAKRPVGSLGSTPLPAGEYRWKPFVSDCYTKPNPLPAWRHPRRETSNPPEKLGDAIGSTIPSQGPSRAVANAESTKEERDATFNQAVKENQTVIVVEPPLNYKLVFDGPTNGGLAKPLVNPVSMALFPHVHGASVCAPLYDHYVAEDGLCYHLYHTSRVNCEVLDPGGYPALSEPTELRHVLQKSLPDAPPPDYPSGRPDAKPVLYLPPPRQCPPITAHCIPLCEVACRQAHGDRACPGARCKMFGAMPSDFMLFEVSEQPDVDVEENEVHSVTTSDANDSKWDIHHSIFAPRQKEAESRTFWDTDRIVRKALDADFGRMLKEDRIVKLMAKSDNAVVNGQKTVAESLEEVKKAFAPFYKTILCIFKYYCLTPSQSVRGAFSIQPNQFGKMMQDADFAGNFISVEEIGKIFVMVNFETDKRSAEATVNEDRALMRFELLEALLRVAITIRDNEGQGEIPPAVKMHTVLEEQLLVNLPQEAMEDSDTFRNECLYTEACDSVLQDHQKALSVAYQKYSMLNPVAGKPSFGLEEWKTFTNDARLVGDRIHMLRMGLRDIKQPFYLARMMVSDEIKSRTKMTQLTFVDFLEALTRLAVAVPIPSDEDMRQVQVTDVIDYEASLSFSIETSSAQHDVVAGATGGPVAPRLDRLIRYILGTLAIRSNGVLKAGNKGLNLVGLYCTKEHLARGILPP
eukprot:g5358.t2